jgi:hypothetical protein
MQEHGAGRPPGAVVIRTRPSRTVTVVLALLALVWVLALAGSESAQPSTSGRVAAGVIFGVLTLLTVAGWSALNRSRRQLEVGRDAIVSRPAAKNKPPLTLTRSDGDTLRILPKFTLYRMVRQPRLLFLGRGGFILLDGFALEGGFPLDEVTRACEAQGWRLDGDSSLAVRDVQSWLHRGHSVEAVQLLQLFGPFPSAAVDDEPHIGLVAGVFEDVGDKLIRGARSSARDAYRRAANAQRAFAGYARSEGETVARMAEADRIEGKARE